MTIVDGDETPEVILSVNPMRVREDAGEATLTVTAAFEPAHSFLVDQTVEVTVAGRDGSVLFDFPIAIPRGETRGELRLDVTPTDDDVVTDDRELSFSGHVPGLELVVRPTVLTIEDDDEAPEVILSASPSSVSEDASATQVTVTAEFSTSKVFDVDQTVTVTVGDPDDTATPDDDYAAAPRSFAITITAGETSGTGEFTLTPVPDGQPNEKRLTVRGDWDVGTTVHPTEVRLTDTDRDPRPTVTLSVEPDAIVEGTNGDVFMTAELSQPRSEETVVTLSLGGTATLDVDYRVDPYGTLTIAIPPNATTTERRLMWLGALEDDVQEVAETIVLGGTAPGVRVESTTITLWDVDARQISHDDLAPSIDEGPAGPAVGEPLAPLTLMAGGHVAAVGLAGAFTGEDLSYVLESSDPAVAAVWLAGETATVASVGEGTATVTVRASNDLGTAVQTFAVTVVTDPAESLAAEATLAAVGRGLLTGIVSTVERRFRGAGEARTVIVAGQQVPLGQARPGGAALAALSMLGARSAEDVDAAAADAAMRAAAGRGMVSPSAQRMLPSRGMTVDDLLRGSAFALSLGSGQGAAGEAAPAGGARWTLWGGGDARSFRGAPGGAEYDGDLLTGHLGVDVQRGGWLAGVALSRSAATAGYGFDGVVSGVGALETTLTNVQPYVRWLPRRGTEVWTIAGVGGGSLSNLRPHVADRLETGDLSMRLGVAGVRQALPAVGRVDVAVRGDIGMLRLATGDGTELIDGLSVDARRLRVGLEASRSVSLGGATLTPFAEVGGRHDGGDGQTGTGLELAGGLRLGGLGSRLAVEARGHVLAVHTASGYAERGGSVTATLTPSGDAGGRGLAVTVLPRWGAPGGAGTLWLDEALGRYGMSGPASGSGALDTRVAYGFGVGRQVLAPFSEVGRAAGGYRRLRMGAQLLGDGGLRFEVGGERLERGASGRSADHRFLFVGGMSF